MSDVLLAKKWEDEELRFVTEFRSVERLFRIPRAGGCQRSWMVSELCGETASFIHVVITPTPPGYFSPADRSAAVWSLHCPISSGGCFKACYRCASGSVIHCGPLCCGPLCCFRGWLVPEVCPDWFKRKMPAGCVLDGEVWGGRGQFQKTA